MDTLLINNYYPYFIFVQAKGRERRGEAVYRSDGPTLIAKIQFDLRALKFQRVEK